MNVTQRVLNLVKEYVGRPVVWCDHLVHDLHMDSLDVMNLTMNIEDAFNINITDKELAKINTVGDIVRHIHRREGTRSVC